MCEKTFDNLPEEKNENLKTVRHLLTDVNRLAKEQGDNYRSITSQLEELLKELKEGEVINDKERT